MMLRNSPVAAALVAALSLAASTSTQVSYPQDGPRTSSGNLVPFGFSSTGRTDEGRFQQLIPARYLPSAGGAIFGLSVISIPGPPQLTYARLKITLSHVIAQSLTTTFANNLPSPVVVLDATDLTLPFVQSDWSMPIIFGTPFAYDGQSDLVIEVQKVYDRARHPSTASIMSSATSANPGRRDLPFPRYTFGTFGSGASTATTATGASVSALKVQLHVAPVTTIALGSDRSGANRSVFAIGGTFWERIRATTGTRFVHLVAFTFNPTPQIIPGIAGAAWIPIGQAIVWYSGSVGPSGLDTQQLAIPNNTALTGAQLTFQSVTLDQGSGRIAFTNASDFLINP